MFYFALSYLQQHLQMEQWDGCMVAAYTQCKSKITLQ